MSTFQRRRPLAQSKKLGINVDIYFSTWVATQLPSKTPEMQTLDHLVKGQRLVERIKGLKFGFTETATSRIARNGPYQLQPRKVAAEAGHCSRQRIARLSNPDVAGSAYPPIVWTLIDPHRAFTYNLRTGLVWFARHRSLGETPPAPLPAESQVQSLGDVTGVCVVGLVW